MKCHEAKRHLDLFMDGELSVPENLKVLEHLNLCRPCGGVYEGEKALRAQLKSQLGSVQAPAGLAERLASAGVAPVTAFRRSLGRSRLFSAAAAAAFFLVALTFVLSSPVERPQAFATEAATKHKETRDGFCGQHRDDCVCVCDNCCSEQAAKPALGQFSQKQVGRETCAHDLSGLGYKPTGASIWRHRGQKVCWTVYRDEAGHAITHGLLTTKIAMEPGPLLVCDGVDRPVELIPAGNGMTCVFVFDDVAEAARFRLSRKTP
ncbi:MAG TPA: zf-HC2 domain-containing protein [Planctomycetota bacterium]|nr:zf-HC2 domain-containing protein [Planctomycetota bacterium]